LEEEPLPPRPPSRKAEAPISKQTTVHPAGVSRRVSPLASFPAAEGAPAIFARAVKEREQGRTSDAIATFRSLQRRFPGTPQAEVSLVSLADLTLASGDATTALEAFDTYLAVAPSGPLATEALLGKTRALGALGRSREADAARAELSRRYPGSPYARPVTGRHIGGEGR
jgi:TolA-binding protein